MFGYIRPAYPELKLREYEAYRACYCGLCRALGSRYGLAARMILNYDFVLLVMLLWQPDEPVRFANARCPVKLCRKRPYCRSCAAMEKSAAMSVVLAYHKLRDDVRDGGLWKRLGARAASRLLRRAYRKAAGEEPDFDRRVRQSLDALTALETAGETSLDRTADTFAGLLSAAAADQTPDSRRRAMEQTLYHVGRFIYILDAWDDLTEDLAGGGYNPVAARYGLTRPPLPETAADELETTLTHSRNLAGAAFELLPDNPWTGTVRNIIAWGMPAICGEVRSGRYKKTKNRRGNKNQ